QNFAVGSTPVSLAVDDFDGDGFSDVAAVNDSFSGTVSVLLNAQDFPAADAPYISINDMTVTEGNTGTKTVSFTVTLSADPGEQITATSTTPAGTPTTADSDYVAKSGTLTFKPGEPLTQTITITVNGDRRGEQNENFYVNLSGAPNA